MSDTTAPEPDTSPRPIVVGVDGSQISYQAVAWAAVEAELRQWPLHLVVAYGVQSGREPFTALGVAEKGAVRSEGLRVLAEAARIAHHAAPGNTFSLTSEAVDELALPALMRRSARARMMVVGNRGRGAIRRAVLGSVSTGLARHAHCPVTVVHGDLDIERLGVDRPVIVGVDGTENSLPAVRMAFEEASLRKAPLIAVHSWCDTSGFDLEVVGWETIRQSEDVLLAEGLAGFGEEFPDVSVERHVTYETPVRALLDYSDRAQLLVVGTHGRGGFAGVVLGSVSTALLHVANCPVLVVRSQEESR
ncbi:universal stress protein [Nocardia sp. CDC153]|uniref:universal stress protein n=1 Tax=Nocardia sp. CDC153 TaxID=3112167 RepID=UPI002DB741E8|nr:universal stress protein [Nocardia sp. CDC153]MEC3957886.1 universal stress protein [Nocardia sp. CDC153]